MTKNMVIVESPAKAKTIERYLGKQYRVAASLGHVRDLPQRKLGVDIEHDFEPTYTVLPGKKKVLANLKKAVGGGAAVFMATDLDREGEAIAWHLCEALKLNPDDVSRVTFNEITKSAITEAFTHPGRINMDKVSAQEARRILDRLVGYKLSPLLWKKVAKGLSAGRVQSVAVRLVVEREREIRAFVPEESWRITADLSRTGDEHTFKATLAEVNRTKFAAANQAEAKTVGDAMRGAAYSVRSVEKRRVKDSPLPPFITSQLQRAASTVLGFSAKKTMTLAQHLYQGLPLGSEGPVALITYMRTDSHRVAGTAQAAARELIRTTFGNDYLPDKPPVYRSRGRAQEAHEAIRPTDVSRTPESVTAHLGRAEARLYELIWKRFVASQMKPALWDVTDIEIEAAAERMTGLFKTRGRTLVFDGHTRVAGVRTGKDDQQLPPLEEGEPLDLKGLDLAQLFTQPPARYTEATLVRKLEELGIGRPSTYAAIITTIQDRGYAEQKKNLFLRCENYPACRYTVPCNLYGKPIGPVVENSTCNACKGTMSQKEGKRCFFATELGEVVTDKLVRHFPKIMDAKFTSHMEDELDLVEEAKTDWLQVVRDFWEPFSAALQAADDEMQSTKNEAVEEAGPCPECGSPLVRRWSKRGPFLGCSTYPECTYTRDLNGNDRPKPKTTEHVCEECGGVMLLRLNHRGQPFLGCENYPKCHNTLPCDAEGNPVKDKPTGEVCDKCGSPMVIKNGRRGPFMACSAFPKCRNAKPLPKDKAGAKPAGKTTRKAPSRGKSKAIPTDRACPDCGAKLVIRSGRRGTFLGCSAYPKCRHTENLPDELKETANAEGA